MHVYIIIITRAHSFLRPQNFAPTRGIWVAAGLSRGILLPNSSFYCGIPRNLTFFIRTTIFLQKMTSK